MKRLPQVSPRPINSLNVQVSDELAALATESFDTYRSLNGLSERQTCLDASISPSIWRSIQNDARPWHLSVVLGALSLMQISLAPVSRGPMAASLLPEVTKDSPCSS